MDIRVGWTKNLCSSKDLPSCSVLDIGTGSGRLLQQLAKQGYARKCDTCDFSLLVLVLMC